MIATVKRNRSWLFLALSIPLFQSSLPILEALPVTSNANGVKDFTHQVTVWDNVIPPNVLLYLHKEASKSGLGHKAFTRRSINGSNDESIVNRPFIETVLDKLLSEIEDDYHFQQSNNINRTQYVEYWTRQEWRHIEAHADIDEHLAKLQDKEISSLLSSSSGSDIPFRFPRNGHVLYLKVGSEVKGPTCLFPNKSSGGDLLETTTTNNDNDVDLVIVPAVEGRLLRFDGTYLHTVPRPADLWFLSFVKGAPEYSPEEMWGRSVILFNTWYDDPPLQVPLDENIGAALNNDGDDDDNDYSNVGVPEVNCFSDWDETFSYDTISEGEVCNEPNKNVSYDRKAAKVWLLGNERRRNYKLRTIKLKAPEETRQLLAEKKTVSLIKLHIE